MPAGHAGSGAAADDDGTDAAGADDEAEAEGDASVFFPADMAKKPPTSASTASETTAPRARGVGRAVGFDEAKASCMKSSPSSGSRPVRTSTATSASANTSVHGPVAPCVRVNCSGAPYAGVNDVTWPLVLANEPAIFCASCTTLAMPK